MKNNSYFFKRKKEIILFFLILAVVFMLMLTFRYGNDFFWHIKSGEYMLKNHTILKTDVFSWYLKSYQVTWISHEWLFEVILYGSSLLLGKYTGVIFVFLGLSLLLFVLYKANKKGFQKNIYFTFFWLLSSLVLTLNTLPRPFLISNLFLALTFYLLYDLKENAQSRKIYFLPFISFFWANIHGGSSNLSYILVFIFYFCGCFHFSLGKLSSSKLNSSQRRRYLIVFFLVLFSICLNPHGLSMLYYPYQNMNNQFMLQTIGEWQPTNFNQSNSLLYLLLLGTFLIPLVISKKKIDFTDFILALCFIFLGFKSIRFWPLAFISFTYIVFRYVTPMEKQVRIFDCALIISSITILVTCCFLFQMPNQKLVDDQFIKILKKEKPKRLYNFYDYGGYLIYQDILVFVDGRADLYSRYNYQDYYNLSMLKGLYEEILKKYDFDYFLLDRGYPLSYYLSKSTQYQLVLEKGNTVLYKQKKDV